MNEEFKVSDNFLNIFRNFNVSDQRKNMSLLTREELFILLDTCIDLHDENDPIVELNFSPFIEEIKNLLTIQSEEISDDKILSSLQKRYGHRLIYERKTINGDDFPSPYNKDEVRNLKINNLFEK